MTERRPSDLLRAGCAALGIALSAGQEEQFVAYAQLLLQWGRRVNLTAAASLEEIVRRHFLDSLLVLQMARIADGARVADLGSGAGFPGVPVKIVRPDVNMVLIESRRRRAIFLETVVRRLGLGDARVWMGRAEALADEDPGSRELVVARGVAPRAAWAAAEELLGPRGRLVCLTSATVAARVGGMMDNVRARATTVRRPLDGVEVVGLVLQRAGDPQGEQH